MIIHPYALVEPAEAAGIRVPDDPINYRKSAYPYWTVFVACQLYAPMPTPNSHFENARIIASISYGEILTITPERLIELGVDAIDGMRSQQPENNRRP